MIGFISQHTNIYLMSMASIAGKGSVGGNLPNTLQFEVLNTSRCRTLKYCVLNLGSYVLRQYVKESLVTWERWLTDSELL